MTAWVIGGALVLGCILGGAIMAALRRAAGSFANGGPTPNEAKAEARAEAQEVMHAPNDDISARIEQLRARGRSGK